MKICNKCKESKLLSKFYADKSKSDGHRPRCKSCENEVMHKLHKNENYIVWFNRYQKEWQRSYRQTEKYKQWRKIALQKQAITTKELKTDIVSHYGGKCACCGISEICFLSIDHINNDGHKSKGLRKNRVSGIQMYKKIIRLNYPNDLQIYCFNCNVAKQHNRGICPHKTTKN